MPRDLAGGGFIVEKLFLERLELSRYRERPKRVDSAPFVFDWVRDYGQPWIDEHAHGVVPEAGTFRYLAHSPAAAAGLGLLVLGVLVCSALDAFLTGLYIERGGSEANPFMALMLIYGYTTFVSVKMALTGTGAWFLAVHQQFPLALHALYGLAFFYLALLAYHMVLAVGFTLD